MPPPLPAARCACSPASYVRLPSRSTCRPATLPAGADILLLPAAASLPKTRADLLPAAKSFTGTTGLMVGVAGYTSGAKAGTYFATFAGYSNANPDAFVQVRRLPGGGEAAAHLGPSARAAAAAAGICPRGSRQPQRA